MLHGALVVVTKDKSRERQIEEAIQQGIRLYQRHNPDVPTLEYVGYVHPKLFAELREEAFSIDVEANREVPYPMVWVCRKGERDVRNSE